MTTQGCLTKTQKTQKDRQPSTITSSNRNKAIMNTIDELRDMNLEELYGRLQLSDGEFGDWLVSTGLLSCMRLLR
uniref:Uncharacterized protein n=1 Tax=Acrobeloides nanus TaxID=290746 RepID=A0A914EIK8_9BILA